MSEHQEYLKNSVEFWRQETEFDKRQFMGSLAIVGCGLSSIGMGIGLTANGSTSGLFVLGMGAMFTAVGISTARSELNDIANSIRQTEQFRTKLDQIS